MTHQPACRTLLTAAATLALAAVTAAGAAASGGSGDPEYPVDLLVTKTTPPTIDNCHHKKSSPLTCDGLTGGGSRVTSAG
jgi:hypothetical protein